MRAWLFSRRDLFGATALLAFGSLLLLCPTACDVLLPGPAAAGSALPEAVTLRIENQSGIDIAAEVVYLQDNVVVRRTVRQLTVSGLESVEEIIPTAADSIVATARLAAGAVIPNGLAAGQAIQTATYQRGVDYSGGEVIAFVIAALPSGEPAPECDGCPICGDLNDDRILDQNDVVLFLAVVSGGHQDVAARLKSDFNQDGIVNGEDVQGFVNCLAGGK
jgi:hypothetical protein